MSPATMTTGKGLLLRLMQTGDRVDGLRELFDRGVTEETFIVPEERQVFTTILSHHRRYGTVPVAPTIEAMLGIEFPRHVPEEPLGFWCDELLKLRLLMQVEGFTRDLNAALDARNIESIGRTALAIHRVVTQTMGERAARTLLELSEAALDRHRDIQQNGEQTGIPFGMPYVDYVTGGAQPGDSIILAARPAVGKTFLMLRWALHMYLLGFRVLFFSMEMPLLQIARRNLALGASVDSRKFRFGQLSMFALTQLRRFITERLQADRDPDDFTLVEGRLKMTTDDVMMLVEQLRPHVLYLDGGYLMKPGSGYRGKPGWESDQAVAEEMKQGALAANIPAIQSFQFNKAGDKKGELATIHRTDAIAQLASVAMGLERDMTGEGDAVYTDDAFRILNFLKGREGERGKVRLKYLMQRPMIEEDRVLVGVPGWDTRLRVPAPDEEEESAALA